MLSSKNSEFAKRTISIRLPAILKNPIDDKETSDFIRMGLVDLVMEIETNQQITQLNDTFDDVKTWNQEIMKMTNWNDTSWLFVECYMVR